MANVLVVIPARGGSKGIPRKNLARVGGHPLVGRAVRAARAARLPTTVAVSTDDVEIAETARRYGATVVERPATISGDTASSESALLHAVDALAEKTGSPADVVVLLQCTSPFVTAEEVDATIEPVASGAAESAFAAVPFHHFIWNRADDGAARGVNHPGGERKRRQDLAPQYLEAGSVYAMKIESLRAVGHRFCGRTEIVEADPERVFEIDSPDELDRARAIAPLHDGDALTQRLPRPVGGIVFDFDGVFTANTVYTDEHGTESVRAHRGDGMGISLLRTAGIPMVVISKERNPVVTARCAKMGLPVFHGVDDKVALLTSWLSERDIAAETVVYVGNDVNDLACMEVVGAAVAPADAHPTVLAAADIILSHGGGQGAVRELADAVLRTID